MENKTVAKTIEKVSNHIPDDISLSILSKLPIKSLKRFACVRKSWSLLFENNNFMNMFRNNFILNCSYEDENTSLLVKLAQQGEEVLYSLSGERFENMVKLDWANLLVNERRLSIFGFGSVNGIFCMHKYRYCKLILWNPATQETKIIPPSPVESVHSYILDVAKDFDYVGVMPYLHGFGYDHVRNDYKVIRFVCHMGEHPDFGFINLDMLGDESLNPLWEIYSVRSNSWRKLDVVDMPYSLDCPEGTQLYMDGVCHWLCEEYKDVGPCLVSFYLSNEVFLTTPIPSGVDDCFEVEALWITLKVLNGSIALISYDQWLSTFHISIVGELGTKESWTKLFIVGPLPGIELPIGVGMKGEIFFTKKDEEELAWFDLSTQMIEKLDNNEMRSTRQIVIYQKNIIHIGGISN